MKRVEKSNNEFVQHTVVTRYPLRAAYMPLAMLTAL